MEQTRWIQKNVKEPLVCYKDECCCYKTLPPPSESLFDVTFTTDTYGNTEIPKHGDVLLSIRVETDDPIMKTTMWMLGLVQGGKVVYDTLQGAGTLAPFPELGFPFVNIINPIRIKTEKRGVILHATFAFLDLKSKLILSDRTHECNVRHRNGRVYTVYGRDSGGLLNNYLGPTIRLPKLKLPGVDAPKSISMNY